MTCRLLRATVVVLVALHAPSALADEPRLYQGMRLVDALQQLQARGLRIVFSSAIVSADLRVRAEPRASTPRQQLGELLAPHGLAVLEGPGRTLQVVKAPAAARRPREAADSIERSAVDALTGAPPAPAGVRYNDFVSVTDSLPPRFDRGVASESSLERDDIARLHGAAAEDPLRVVHSFPGVAAVDDFGNDFAVRGSPFRHIDVVVEGVSTDWLRHTAAGRRTAGSVTMLSGLVIERATLRTGAYPRRHRDRLGSELDLSLRQGSRDEVILRGMVGRTEAVLVAEGPLGRAGSTGTASGSWLVSGRRSFLEWPPERSASARTPFGFSDGMAKVVFDLKPTQELAVVAIAGASTVDPEEDGPAPTDSVSGANGTSAVSVSWRSTLGPSFFIRQQGSIVTRRFWNTLQGGPARDSGTDGAIAYRAEVSRAVAGGMLEAKALVERATTTGNPRSPDASFAASSWLRSGFAHFSWPATPSLTVSPGIRVTWSTLTPRPIISRWLLGEWSFRRGWNVIGSVGASRQLPELQHLYGEWGSAELRAERAAHVDLGIEQQQASGVRWQVTVFSRNEADILRAPDLHPRLVGNTLAWPSADARYSSALRGTSRGVELLVSRRAWRGLSGWAAYAYNETRQRDPVRGETFWADFDQRHTLNVFAQYRLSPTTSAGATFRAGSGFPIRGYLAGGGAHLVVGDRRNEVRLPPYARLDLRANRQFRSLGRSFVLFAEGLNVLNRTNVGATSGSIDPVTGATTGFTEPLLPRRLSAGIVFEF